MSNVGYFNPNDVLVLNTALALSGAAQWICQSDAPSMTNAVAKGLNAAGDVSKTKKHNKTDTVNLVYECQADSGMLTIPKAGVIINGYHVDSVKVDYSNAGWPKLSITVHKHSGAGGTHAEASCRTYTGTVALPAQFGIPAALTDTAAEPASIFALTDVTITLRSLAYSLTVTHVDEPGRTGDWFAGENRAGIEQIDADFLGIPAAEDVTVSAAWIQPSDSGNRTNQAAETGKLTITHDLSFDVPPEE